MMCVLVLADNLLLLYAGWEGVGLCSYLLIGFWFEKPSAAPRLPARRSSSRASATLDCILGIFLLWLHCGYRLDYSSIFFRAKQSGSRDILNTACLLLVLRRGRQIGAVPAARLAAGCDGRPDAGLRPDPRGDDGDGRRVPRRSLPAALRARADGPALDRGHRRHHDAPGRAHRADAERPQAGDGVFDRQPTRIHVPRARQRSRRAGRRSARRRRSSTCSRTPSSRRCSSSRPAASCMPWAM